MASSRTKMTKKCRTCGKPLPNPQLDYCNLECTLLDSKHVSLSWRQAKLEAIHKARLKGYSEKWIVFQLLRAGLTPRTAWKMMEDSREAYGNGEQ